MTALSVDNPRFSLRTIRVGTQHVSLAPLVGCPFGASFEVVDGRLSWVAVREDGGAVDLEADERSNKQLLDDGTAQVCAACACLFVCPGQEGVCARG